MDDKKSGMKFFGFLLVLVSFSLLGQDQIDQEEFNNIENLPNRVKVLESQEESSAEKTSLNETGFEEDLKDADDIHKARANQAKLANQIASSASSLEVNILNEDTIKTLQQQLKSGALSRLSKNDLEKFINERVKLESIKKYLLNSPRLLDFMVAFFKDEHALPRALGVILKKKDLSRFTWIMILLFFASLFVKPKIRRHFELRSLKSFLFGVCFSLVMMSISLAIFYKIFQYELSPTLELILRHL
jgi:hypothetical protein